MKQVAKPASTEVADAPERLRYGLRLAVLTGASKGLSRSIGRAGLVIGTDDNCDLVLQDRRVSRRHLRATPHPGGVRLQDLDSRNGVFLRGVRVTDAVAPPGTVVVVGTTELIVEPDEDLPSIPLTNADRIGGLIGRSPRMRQLFTLIERAAPTDYTVLVEGETGTGKEVVARTIHELSSRRVGPFVVFDCSATAEALLESDLFGHVRGAFTGAVAPREGAIRRAHGGTLFIDELNSLSLPMQGKLLRALETRRILPVGADQEIEVDVRFVAAANAPLHDEVKAKRFRQDLFFRISVVRIELPPLRDRREDIALLVGQFLQCTDVGGEISGPNLDRLSAYKWPGNVRELRNVMERALALAGPGAKFSDLPILLSDTRPALAWALDLDRPLNEVREQVVATAERQYAKHMLERTEGNVSEAARRAGVSRRHFTELVRKYGLRDNGEDEG